MKEKELAKLVLKKEARENPEGKVIIGNRVLTYRELEQLIDSDKDVEKHLVKPFTKLLRESKSFLREVMRYANTGSSS